MNNKTNMKKEKKNYESPQLTVVEFRVERGFASSNLALSASNAINAYVDAEMAIRVAEQDGHGEVIASTLGENYDQGDLGSGWQYSNGSWF